MDFLPKRYQKQPPDIAHEQTEQLLDDMIAEIESVYGQAYTEMKQKAEKYLAWFVEMDEKKRKQFEKGEIAKKDYQDWRKNKLLEGRRWYAMSQTLADDLANSNGIAASIIGGYLPEVYAINGNYTAYVIEHSTQINTSFTLFNEQAIERLIREKPDLLPKPKIDIPKDIRWNKQNMTSAVMQSIIQGEDTYRLADRLAAITDANQTSAIRNARTMTTSAQNGGREDQFKRAQAMGIKSKKVWIATWDFRTRESHRRLDGEIIKMGEKFSNGLRYPGDPNGTPAEVYNCRCTEQQIFPDQDFSKFERNSKLGDMSYETWKNSKGGEPEFKTARNKNRDKAMHKEFRNLIGNKVPRKFAYFQDIKYNSPNKWAEMKSAARKARNQKRRQNGK